ncbi:hypothetical protein WME90_44920 [Sorangium sp. So ce375]|uniref:hypothetical protein n=1 Tax=Sorangium sp. So ce375 TaxID=3133306 RepID=UPI003F5AF7F8
MQTRWRGAVIHPWHNATTRVRGRGAPRHGCGITGVEHNSNVDPMIEKAQGEDTEESFCPNNDEMR